MKNRCFNKKSNFFCPRTEMDYIISLTDRGIPMKSHDAYLKIFFSILVSVSIVSAGTVGRDIPDDYFVRLVDAASPDNALDTVRLNTEQSMTVIVQVMSTRNPQWIEASGYWSLGSRHAYNRTPSTAFTEFLMDNRSARYRQYRAHGRVRSSYGQRADYRI
jgi:hypothetical protein